MAGLFSVLTGCAGYSTNDGKFVSVRHGFEIRPPGGEPWRRTPDVANLLSLNDPSTSVLYFDNPYSGGVISLQVLPRHYPGDGKMIDELRYIYRRMLSVPYANMRTVVKEKFIAFELSVRQAKIPEAERAEFNLKGSMGRRPSTLAREEARRALEFEQPFGGPKQVLEYLGRYTHRVAISNNRILDIENNTITFSYKDRKNDNEKSTISNKKTFFIFFL